jgi:moderate conductance mechanosensitive channel
MELNETLRWILGRGVGLLIGTVVLLVIYRIGLSAIHRLVPTVINAQAAHLPSGSSSAEEVGKRVGTIEDLLRKLLRLGVLAGFLIVTLAVFELWGILAVIVLIVVAVVFATKDVVLDYVMGFLILVEGPFFKGDYVTVGGHPGIEGVVEEIGLRRTLLRDATGASNAVSNGLIRLSTNLTRLFSVAVVDLHILHAGELDAALATMGRVAAEMREDAAWADRFPADAPTNIWVTGIGMDGASVRLQQRVQTGAHGDVASELRRRLVGALASASVATGRWDTPMPIDGGPAFAPRGG